MINRNFQVGDVIRINKKARDFYPDDIGKKAVIIDVVEHNLTQFPYMVYLLNRKDQPLYFKAEMKLKKDEMDLVIGIDEIITYNTPNKTINRKYCTGDIVKLDQSSTFSTNEGIKMIYGYTKEGYVINSSDDLFEIFEDEIEKKIGSDFAFSKLIQQVVNKADKNNVSFRDEYLSNVVSDEITTETSQKKSIKEGKLFCFMGVSGSGKSTIQHSLPIPFLTNYTTRDLREGEEEGIHVHTVSKDTFNKLIEENKVLEWAEYSGNYYGTPAWVKEELDKGKSFHSTKEIKGIKKLKEILGEEKVIVIYIKPPSISKAISRMEERGDSKEEILKRMKQMVETNEFENENYADYVISNDDLTQAQLEAHQIVIKELIK